MRRLRDAAAKVPPVIEPELQAIRLESEASPYLRRQLIGVQYYIRDVIHIAQRELMRDITDHVTNYVELVHEIEKWRSGTPGATVCFVTFNYDTLLEEAMRGVLPSVSLRHITNYIGDERYKVIKLHGSIDWAEALPAPGVSAGFPARFDALDSVWEMDRTGQYVTLETAVNMPGYHLRPAIAIPTATKTHQDFACPQEHIVVGTTVASIVDIQRRLADGFPIRGVPSYQFPGGFGMFTQMFRIREFLGTT